jgi:hypothetical protein
LERACYMRATRSKARAPKWPAFAPPQWKVFTPPLTVMIIGEAFIRAKQSLICLNNPENTCVCGHYEPLNKRWFLNPYAGAAFNEKGGEPPFAATWDKARRVIAKIDWHPGELFPRAGFIVTKLPMEPDEVTRYYNRRGTAEQHIKEGKYAFHWTRLSCKKFRDNEARLQLHALAYNLATFLRGIKLPEAMADWSLTSLQLKLIKIGARVVRHSRAITFQLAEVAVTGPMVRAILAAIHRLRAPPISA